MNEYINDDYNDKKKKNNTKKIIFAVFLVIVLFVGIAIGYSVAYFSATVVNDPGPSNTVVTTGGMKIEYTDGPQVSLENSLPGQYIEKTFTIKNIGSLDAYYDVYLSDLINTFVDKVDLKYTLTSTDGGANAFETEVPASTSKIVNNKLIGVNQTHTYTLKIEFKETNSNQNVNKDKSFSSIIRVTDSKAS